MDDFTSLPPAPIKLPREGPPPMSPRARRRAAELNVPLNALPLPGNGRRISEADVLVAAEKLKNGAPRPAAVLNKSFGRGVLVLPDQPLRLPAERESLDAEARRAAADWSYAQQIPQVHLSAAVLAQPVLAAQRSAAAETGLALQPADFFIQALGRTLAEEEFRAFTGVLDRGDVVYRGQINVALATAAGTAVIAGADQLGLKEIAGLREDLCNRLTRGQLKSEETHGALFTLLIIEGADSCEDLVSPGQTGVLGIGDPVLRPMKVANDIVIAPVWALRLTVDRRLIDPALGAKFLSKIRGFIERPTRLIY